jgi:hypothetical protein
MSRVNSIGDWMVEETSDARLKAETGIGVEELSLRATALMVGLWLATVSVAQQHHASIDIRYDTR